MASICCVIGTRPEAIKMAPIVLRLRDCAGVTPSLVSTGQHRDLVRPVLDAFGLHLDRDLDLMEPGQTLAGLSAKVIAGVDACLAELEPDLVLVQGDTTTALCAALAAFYRKIPVGHVEAGLRTGDLQSPWPEEANRVLTDHLAALHFAPTISACANLEREGIAPQSIEVTGNTGIDALLWMRERVDASALPAIASSRDSRRIVLITAHRRESFGAPFDSMCGAIDELASRFADVRFVFPLHPNPQVRSQARARLRARPNIELIEPLPYPEFVALMDASTLILTDSGGVQEEAPSLGKPVLVMRETTERPEAIEAGTVRLVGTAQDRIVGETSHLLTDGEAYAHMARAINPYGDGQSAPRIVRRCLEHLGRDVSDS